MIHALVDLITKNNCQIEDDVLLIEHRINNLADFLDFLRQLNSIQGLLESELLEDELKEGDLISLELSIASLSQFGVYTQSLYFFNNHRYSLPENNVFLYDEGCYIDQASFYENYKAFVNLVAVLESMAKYSYLKVDDKYAFIGREDRYILVPLIFSLEDIVALSMSKLGCLNQFLNVMRDSEVQEKKHIFLNELIDFLSQVEEATRLITFVNKIDDFLSKAGAAFSFYLSDFKFNKLKLEIDSKLLEFNQKIQGVINDSQNKLIAIPAAFVLGLTSFDYQNTQSIKNLVILISLFVFTLLLQIFISNQKTALLFIEQNIKFYKDSFGANLASGIKDRFVDVDKEFKKQKERLFITNALLWFAFISSAAFYLCQLFDTVYPSFLIIFYLLFFLGRYMCIFYVYDGRTRHRNS
ncbi:hypothetical protein [Sphingobacterium corticibacterium]|uniref:Uncharacterized protein n=1 Tax=Sphingobacterium corticibacterium TaxID=2484746 RepID=A0A4Q6XMR2_9SPHI|nr:hypothetical protein [Sphingobacterium corticibacterium]RZF61460.1 hypothetical protein EWE74_01050 [Sphingobacterium corticibacterium]